MPQPEGFGGSSLKQLWMQKHMQYFNTPEKERMELGLTFPNPSEYGVNPRDPVIKRFLAASFDGDEARIPEYEEAADIHQMLAEMKGNSGVGSGQAQLARRLAELGYPINSGE